MTGGGEAEGNRQALSPGQPEPKTSTDPHTAPLKPPPSSASPELLTYLRSSQDSGDAGARVAGARCAAEASARLPGGGCGGVGRAAGDALAQPRLQAVAPKVRY
jgi:hypothetical protein